MGYTRKGAAFLTADEYLALETRARTKHEYLEGVIYAWQGQVPEGMAGGTRAHHRISLNIATTLNAALRSTSCSPYMANMRLRVAAAAGRTQTAYFYPDIFVHCGPPPAAEATEIENPKLIIEVLSPRTEEFDRTEKFAAYATIASVEELVLVNSHPPYDIEIFRRDSSGMLVRFESGGPDLALTSVGVTMTREAVLAGV
jgi:Uma2 family endonuclease